MELFNYRKSYTKDKLSINDIGGNPIDFFVKWFKEAENSDQIIEPNAMTISTVDENSFEIFPLMAWKSTHKKWDGKEGDIVKIKYRVTRSNTKLWIYDTETNKLVHEQSIIRDPWPDGRYRDFTYVWKLYKTERTQYIPSGDYIIVIGSLYEPVSLLGKITTSIKI